MTPLVSVGLLRAQSDHRLLELARDGHERAFEALVRRYHKPLLAYGRRLVPAAVAEDAVQQSLLQAWQALQRGTEVRDLAPWLHRIVYHSAIRMQRPRGDDRAAVAPASTADPPHAELERQMAARDALAGVAALPALQREALLQTALEGRTHQQVADTLGVTDGAVRGLLYRARTTLRAAATALTPVPIAGWAVHGDGGGHGSGKQLPNFASSLSDAGGLSDLGGRAGGVGVAAVLGKGGAIAISAGVLVAGTAAMHHELWRVHAGAGAQAGRAGHPGAVAASLPGVTSSAELRVGSTFAGARAAVAASSAASSAAGASATAATSSAAARASTRLVAGSGVGGVGGSGSAAQAGGSVRALVGRGAGASSRKDRPAAAAGRGARPTTSALVGPGPLPATGSATTSTAGATSASTHQSGSGNTRSSATGNAGSGAAGSGAASTSGRSNASTGGSNGNEDTSTPSGTGSSTTAGVPKSSDNQDDGGATATSGGAAGSGSGRAANGSGNNNASGGSASAAPAKTASGTDD